MTNSAKKLSNLLSSRYGLDALHCDEWSELELWGGIGMDVPIFNALVNAAREQGDTSVRVYELESVSVEFQPVDIALDYESFNGLKANTISLFDVVMVPPSRRWVALMTSELETFVYGSAAFINAVSNNLMTH